MYKFIQTSLNFLLEKESLEKKTSKNFDHSRKRTKKKFISFSELTPYGLSEMKVNPISKFNYYIKNNRSIRIVGLTSSSLLILLFVLSIYPISNNSNHAEALNGIASTTSLDMTLDHTAANLDLVVGSSSGTFAMSDSDSLASFTVATNNYTGYTLSIVGSDDTGLLTNTDSTITTNNTLSSITSAIDAGVFGGDTATSLNGKWGYQPSKYYDLASNAAVDNTDFLPSPTTSASTLNITACANGTPTTTCPNNQAVDEYTIAIGARADYTTLAGTYTNTFILSAVTNNVPFTVTFNDNTNDSTVSSLPSTISSVTADTNVALPTTIPTRTGYTFAGWCDTVTTVNTNGTTTCTNPTTGVNGTVYSASTASTTSYLDFIDQTASSNIASLYAMWNINTYNVTVNFAGSGVESVVFAPNNPTGITHPTRTVSTSGDTANLVYNTTYTVSMNFTSVDDYELDSWSLNDVTYGTLSSTSANPTSFTTNASSGSAIITATGRSKDYCTDSDDNCMQYSAELYNCGNTLTDARDGATYTTKIINNRCWMTQNLRFAGEKITTALTDTDADKTIAYGALSYYGQTSEAAIRNYGNVTNGVLYNYVAATAMTITGPSNKATASYSICPAGWRLPTVSELSGINSNSGFNPVGSGYATYNSIIHGNEGYWWASTLGVNTTYRGLLNWDDSGFNTNVGIGDAQKYYGLSIRCIRRAAVSATELYTMQTFTNSLCQSYASDQSVGIKDARDGNIYNVRYISGNCWMTQNLRFTGENLTTELTDTDANKTIVYGDLTSGQDFYEARIHDSGDEAAGVWYNFAAATAATNTGDSVNTMANYSLCPAGWRLPNSDEATSILSQSSAFSPVTTGRYRDGTVGDIGAGRWWLSTTADKAANRGTLYWSGSKLSVSYGGRGFGYYIRCIRSDALELIAELKSGALTMQRFGSLNTDDQTHLLSYMATGTAYSIIDSRDNKTYKIAKLADDRVWMLDNLALASGTLTPENSNVAANFTLPASSSGSYFDNNDYLTIPVINSDYINDYGGLNYGAGSGKIGVYYNYCAASAGTFCYSYDDTEPYVGTNLECDVCPKGWAMPTSGTNSDIANLYALYGSKKETFRQALSTGLTGLCVYGGCKYYTENFGNYWTRTIPSQYGVGVLQVSSGGGTINTNSSGGDRTEGYSIRCLLKK